MSEATSQLDEDGVGVKMQAVALLVDTIYGILTAASSAIQADSLPLHVSQLLHTAQHVPLETLRHPVERGAVHCTHVGFASRWGGRCCGMFSPLIFIGWMARK